MWLKYFEADHCDIVNSGWFESSTLDEAAEVLHHFSNRQTCELAEFFRALKAACDVKAADNGFGPVGVEQQFVTGV
jgi:hypothetical protein